ncbi:hypothetical protein MKX01_017756, partial [Papaver californicum]
PSASPSESNGSPPAATTTLPADEAHANLSASFPTHTTHRNFGSKFLKHQLQSP